MLESFFIYGTASQNVEEGVYQIPLVILSFMVASFASYTALVLAQQLLDTQGRLQRRLLHWGGAFAMGAGIWSMHFIGMLSYKMDMVVAYAPGMTILSMIIAIGFSYAVLHIVGSERNFTLPQILISGLLLGIGICSMHYTGMAAMEMDADLRYTPGFFALSVLIAIAASAMALATAFTLSRHNSRYRYLYQIGAALIMGAAICGMHYTGMMAAVFLPWADCRYDPHQDFDMLAVSVAATTMVILGIALAVGAFRKTQVEYRMLHYMRELEESNRNLDDFVYIASHDLKEPIRGIANYARFLQEDYGDKLDEEGRKQLEDLEKMSRSINALIDDLLQYSRVGRADLIIDKTNVNEMIEETLELMKAQTDSPNVEIVIQKNLPVISCNKTLVAEIFRNLITNALKYNDKKNKRVEIGVTTQHETHKGRNVFYVRDNGIGIPAQFHETVFKMFKRLHGRDQYGGGTGSGLAIVRKIIERHQGEIWIESEEGEGSVFYFTLDDCSEL